MSASGRCIFFTGAPNGETLDWDEAGLLSYFDVPIRRYLGTLQTVGNHTTVPTTTKPHAKWRSVAYDETTSRLLNKQHDITWYEDTSPQRGGLAACPHEDADFLEHSLAVLEELDSSHMIGSAVVEDIDRLEMQTTDISFATSLTETSIHISNESFYTASPTQNAANEQVVKLPGDIADLKHLPKADHITRIHPQTVTKNLLVGIISISPIRTVQLRRRRGEMDIIELIVGDDTRAGFSISFWLVPMDSQKPADDLRQSLSRLESGQIILLQNVALSAWRGNVYGASLNKRFARNSTVLTVVGESAQQSLSTPVMSKLQRVKDWAAAFLGSGKRAASFHGDGSTVKKRKVDELPPDTQD